MKLLSNISEESCNETSIINKPKKAFSAIGSIVGVLAIALALISFSTNMQVHDILAWLERNFGISFMIVYTALVSTAMVAMMRLYQGVRPAFWFQVGIQSANGISTLALTFTLLGISLGIGALSEQTLSPETVDSVISTLTAQFSIAFMTSVLGLPSAAIVRAILSIIATRNSDKN